MSLTKLLPIAAAILASACGGGGGGGSIPGSSPGGNAELLAVHQGRLVDVYGLRNINGELNFSLFQTDVLIGPDIQDERDTAENKPDEDILYDFTSANPDNLQPRLFIPREITSVDFHLAFEALDDSARLVAPSRFGETASDTAFSVVPRNAGIRLTFAAGLGINNDFFVERDEDGRIIGVRNAEAVQLLKIVGDPTDSIDVGDFEVIPTRIAFSQSVTGQAVDTHHLIIDPVLLGSEGLQYQTRNNASGMPEAPDQIGANIRIAVALEGPLRIHGVREDQFGNLSGLNNSSMLSVIRDMRSGNRLDDSADISRGFIRDPIPPRIVGQIHTFLERVDDIDEFTQEVTLFKNGVIHEIDRGDALRFLTAGDSTGKPAAVTEVVVDPLDDRGSPETQHVRVRIRRVPKVTNDLGQLIDPLENLDPSNDPDYPQDPDELESWLVLNAARSILTSEFTASRVDLTTGRVVKDDPRNFITFSPTPLPLTDGSPSEPNQNVSPFAGAIIRFTKPVDLSTVDTADSFFFATRNLLDPDEIAAFKAEGGRGPGSPAIDPGSFREAKFRTPHLVASRLFDEDGSQTALRLQPILGFFLNDKVREDEDLDFEDKKYRYFLHLLSGTRGITGLSGNPIDFQANDVSDSEQIVIPFALDTRMRNAQDPVFPDNIVVSVVRTYNDPDEDEQPSYYQNDEIQEPGGMATVPAAQSVPDIFGAVTYLPDGLLLARPTVRVTHVVDNLNQPPPPAQNTDFRWCPETVANAFGEVPDAQVSSNSASTLFGQGIQNPLNPFGCRLQTVWREIDLGLSRVDPFDFNLDVEQMYWAPFARRPITFDEFDRVSLFLGHSEKRPEPCVNTGNAFPSMQESGLGLLFQDNYLHNRKLLSSERESAPPPHAAYVDTNMVVDPSQAITEPNGINRYLPLPPFQKPYFVWRDETVEEQGGESGAPGSNLFHPDYILSPFLGGYGAKLSAANMGELTFNQGTWANEPQYNLQEDSRPDTSTGGMLAAIALPLLADFWTYCDSPELPVGNGFVAAGINGWQIALTVGMSPLPAFRSLSSGFAGSGARPAECVDPSSQKWRLATGGFTPQGTVTASHDNSLYWVMIDFLKRSTVVTAGFVDITNPHRMPERADLDPRLGPYLDNNPPVDVLPTFSYAFQPALEKLPGGTSGIVEFRGAGIVDPMGPPAMTRTGPWRAVKNGYDPIPDKKNFPLDPLKAGDAGIRRFDDRPSPLTGGAARNWWTYFYNRTVTTYTAEPNTLMDPLFTNSFSGPFESFLPHNVKYFNWRFVLTNNVETTPPISPSINTFIVTYRFERVR